MSRPVHHEATASVPEAVTELFAQLGVRFSFDPTGPGFSYRETRDGDEHVSVARLSMGGEFSTWGDTEVFGVVRVRGARYDWSTSDDQGSGLGQPVLFRPGHPALVVAKALEATNVYLTAAVLQEVADTVYGLEHTPVAFVSSRPASPALGRYWSGLVGWAAEAAAAALLAEPLVRTDLTRRLAVGMLECFPLTGDREIRSLSMAAQARRYRIAVAFLDDNAHLPVTVEDAARAAGTTTTALVRAFRASHPWASPRASTCGECGWPVPTKTSSRGIPRLGTRSERSRSDGAFPTRAASPAPTARSTGSPRAGRSNAEPLPASTAAEGPAPIRDEAVETPRIPVVLPRKGTNHQVSTTGEY